MHRFNCTVCLKDVRCLLLVPQLLTVKAIYVLCRQEGVADGIYVPIEVNVHTPAGKVLTCRSYQMRDYVRGPPSPQYKKVGVVSGENEQKHVMQYFWPV